MQSDFYQLNGGIFLFLRGQKSLYYDDNLHGFQFEVLKTVTKRLRR
jgi:hypothetical protein